MPASWVTGTKGDFPVHQAVADVLPKDATIVAGVATNQSEWVQTAKISVTLQDGTPRHYFIKCATTPPTRTLIVGEYNSTRAIESVVPGFGPEPVGQGTYVDDDGTEVCFYIQAYLNLDTQRVPDPAELASQIAKLHLHSTSPTGMFGFHVPTGGGFLVRPVDWTPSWAAQYAAQLQDTIELDNAVNGVWPAHQAACTQLLAHVIPRLLGALQADGRTLTPALVHLDLWENNVATDVDSGKLVIFDPGCVYGHNEIEFGTWRTSWARHFSKPAYREAYQRLVPPSEPAAEWDDRNRLYSVRAKLNDSIGHPDTPSRVLANNDILYLCEKYAPLDTLPRYDPAKELGVYGVVAAEDAPRCSL